MRSVADSELSRTVISDKREAQHIRQPHIQSIKACISQMIRIVLYSHIVELDHFVMCERLAFTLLTNETLSECQSYAAANHPKRCVQYKVAERLTAVDAER